MEQDTKLTVALKTGDKFEISLKNPTQFYRSIKSGIDPTAENNLHAIGPYLLQVSEIAAIYPSEQAVNE